jgi:hypothetical protein
VEQVLTLAPGPMGFRPVRPAELPLGALVLGRPVEEVVALLPRLFNLCRMAQGMAARLSLGLPAGQGMDALVAEVLRDHLIRLSVILPPLLGLPARAPAGNPLDLLFGSVRGLPVDLLGLRRWMEAGEGSAPLVSAIYRAFAPGEAAVDLPYVCPATALRVVAVENSAAGRQATHPLLRSVAARHGRGPLWRVLGMLADAEAALAGRLPPPVVDRGVARVPAARGTYALMLGQIGGLVSRIERVTPTDHLLAPGGALETALAALPVAKRHLAPVVAALHDPCMAVKVEGMRHA